MRPVFLVRFCADTRDGAFAISDLKLRIFDVRSIDVKTHLWAAKYALLVTLFSLASALSGCESHRPAAEGLVTLTVTDDLGRELKLRVPLRRAISLAPSITEMVFAAGAGDRLVGVTTFCNFPENALSIEKIGDTQTPNLERIIALKPDVVFVSTASQLEAFFRVIEQQDIEVYVLDVRSLDDLTRSLSVIGKIFGTEQTAEAAAAALTGRINAARHSVERKRSSEENDPKEDPVRVFVQISNEPLFTIGRDSFLNEIVEIAGGVSATKNVPTAFPKISKESALALRPEAIILSESEDNREPNPVFANSPAVMNRRVHRINADIISRPGPRLVDAIEELARLLNE